MTEYKAAEALTRPFHRRVAYSAERLLEKNKDPLSEDLLVLMRSSTEPLIAALFGPPPASVNSAPPAGGRGLLPRRGGFRGVALQFSAQLDELLRVVERSQPHFIRCIKPNTSKLAHSFDPPTVLRQLRCGGVIEAVRIDSMP